MGSFYKIISAAGKVIFPSLLWNFNIKEKCIYLTFDDGPVPEITPWVLGKLKEFNARATFFCIGNNVQKNPEIFRMILNEGHVIGNHSHNHLNGWNTDLPTYIENVLKAETAIHSISSFKNREPIHTPLIKKLYRPPYGRIKPSQIKKLESQGYKIVMWDVISGDYDQSRKAQTCIKDVKGFSKPGSIIVFHDSIKAGENLKEILPEILRYYTAEGFEFKSL